ncbi:MAG: hypothetical protein Q4C87_10475 [Actinomycetaceae bacterium]|nr:hypothetical protein [Actinomycetaceae bacterium]
MPATSTLITFHVEQRIVCGNTLRGAMCCIAAIRVWLISAGDIAAQKEWPLLGE